MKSPNSLCLTKGIILYCILLCTIFLNNIESYSQVYPQQQSIQGLVWETYQIPQSSPQYLVPFNDPITGNKVTRISDPSVFNCNCNQLRHRYSKNQPWNADGTKIMTDGSPAKILDGTTYEVIATLNCRALWSNVDPNITYDAASGNQFVRKNIVTQSETVLRTFTGFQSLDVGYSEGNLSIDDRWVALIANNASEKTLIIYDILNNVIVGQQSFGTASIDWVSMSQSGNYVVVQYNTDGSGTYQGTKVYDRNLNFLRHLTNRTEHGDLGFDQQGNEVFVAYDGANGYSLSYIRLDNGVKQGLFPYTGATGDRGLWGGHISCRNIDRPGWAYVSEHGHDTNANLHEATREIFAIKLDGSNTIERFAKHNTNINVSNGFYHQAHAVPNRDGSKVLFASNWDNTQWKSNPYPMMWIVEADQNTESITANAGQDVSICQGQSTTLTASGGSTYLWNTGATTANITVNPNTTTTYSVTAFSASGNNSDTDDVIVTVNTPPTANAGTDLATCLGAAVTLTASGGSTYLWSTGATTQSITVNPNATTTYSVQVTQNGCTSSDQVIVTVNQLPTINAGNDVTIFEGESVTLSASGGTSYVWSTGATTQSITVSPIATTIYTVTGTGNGCQNTDTVTVFLVDDGVTVDAGNDTDICQGESVTLTASGGTTYLWNTGATTASITVNPNTTTTYSVTAYSISGNNSDTDDVTVTVNIPPTANAGNDVATCQGAAVTLTASGGSSYLWSNGATTQSITVNPNTTTTYSVEVTQNGCSSTDQVVVTVNQLPTINAGNDVTIFTGESVTLSASGGTSYVWNTGSTTQNITVSPTTTTTYTVIGTGNGCQNTDSVTVFVQTDDVTANAGQDVSICQGQSTTLTASGGTTYLWSTGATTANITVNPNTTTTYSVTAYSISGNNSDTDDVTVTVNIPPTANAGNDVATCQGTAVTLTASGGSTYLWSNGATTQSITVNPNATTTYSVEVTQNGCSSTDQVVVTVNQLPTINAGNDVTIFTGESVTLSASGGTSYVWNTGSTTQNITVSPTTTTTYTVIGTGNGCQNTDSVTVFVQTDDVTANAGQDVSICQGQSTTLTASGGTTYLWNTGATTASITVNPNTTTTYTVTAYSISGNNSDTDEVTVTVNIPPTANAGNDVATCQGTAVTLTASGGSTYLWSNGATTQSITVNPNATTTYSVEVTQNGCSSTDQVIVTVNQLPTINAGNDVTIFTGESVTLSASGGTSYVWNTGATTQNITVNPTTTTTYTVTGSANGCQNTDSVTVFVNVETVTANAGVNETICQGYSTTLTATGGDTYLWSTGATTQSITVTPNATSNYTVTVFAGNAQDSDDVTVFVNPNPNVSIINGDEVMILEGEFITLSATGANTYLWNNGATQPNIAVSPPNTTTYSVTGFINNCEDEKEVQVNVLERVNAEIQGEQSVCLNESIVLTAVGNTNAEYLWNTGEITQSITVSPTEDTQYSVTVYNALDYDISEMMVTVTDCAVIIPEEPETFEFLVYPNPTSGELNIKINGLMNVASIYLYDVSGKSLYYEKINEDEQQSYIKQLNMSNYASGVYFLKLVDNTSVITKKIIVN